METKERRGWRGWLRGAVSRGDGAAVVGLARHGMGGALQLVGDGLVVALAQEIDGAAEAAAGCAQALRDRAWPGDDDLADHLDAMLVAAATPMLAPLPVDLDDLAGILEGDELSGGGRIDRHTGEVWSQGAIDYAQEIGEEDPDGDLDPERWLWVDCEGSRDGYRDMQLFIGTISDPGRADRLEIAIQGRGAFRRFKNVLDRWPADLDRWYAFSEDRRRGRARAWLADAGYHPSPPTQPPPPH